MVVEVVDSWNTVELALYDLAYVLILYERVVEYWRYEDCILRHSVYMSRH